MAFGQSFAPISGPPSSENTYNGVFGSAAGLLLNWEPFTFGQRKSKIETAKALYDYQQADAANEVFQHQVRTISAYLDIVMADELIKVYRNSLKRSEEYLRIVRSLTLSGLRPGTDTALFNADLSRARIELLNYEKLKATQEIYFEELLGGDAIYSIDSSFFQTLPADTYDATLGIHPLIRLSASKTAITVWEKTTLQRTLYPKLSFWGTAYARGSGIRYDGFVNSQDGLSFSRYNYGAGLVLSLPLLRFVNLRYQLDAQESFIKAEVEKQNLAKLQLEKQNQLADVTLSNALKIAHEIPSFYESAEFSYRTLKSRYNSGLTNYTDLIQAHYNLIRSEADLKRAYIDSWRALLYKAAVQGNIDTFLNQLK
jgi:outer membrane protein